MTREELVYNLFGVPQEKKIYLYSQEIEEALSSQIDKVTIDVREIDWQDPRKKLDEPTYLDDELLKFTETGISILQATPKTTEMLRKYIPRTVKELTIPSTFLEDLSFLQEFPNLETLHISDYSTFPKEVIHFIEKNTPIKNLTLRSPVTLNRVKGEPGFNIIEAGNTIGQFGKLTLFNKGYTGEWKPSMKIYTSSYDKKNLDTLEALYEEICSYLPPLTSVSITKEQQDLYKSEFELDVSDGKITKMMVKEVSPTEISKVYKEILKKTSVKKTQFTVENQTYDDIHQLKQIDSTSDLTIRYRTGEDSSDATYEEFQNMRGTIDYYKELLETSNLSPVEKVAYVYDILKTMRYQENHQDKQRPRNIHSIVTDGTIVCRGYSEFAKQLLSEVGIKCLNVSVTCLSNEADDAGHARNFVRIDDDKYNIHGLYVYTQWI